MRKTPGLKALMELKDVDLELAKAIRDIWREARNLRLARIAINRLFDASGVEYLGKMKRGGDDVFICNAGDTYAPTIGWVGDRMVICTQGDFFDPVEKLVVPGQY